MSGTLVAHNAIGFQFDSSFDAAKAPTTAANAQEERDLIARLSDGEEAAYETLIARFEHPIFNLVSRLTNDPGDAPDVVQEVFLKVFRNVHSFRGQSSLKTWIYRIAVNESRNLQPLSGNPERALRGFEHRGAAGRLEHGEQRFPFGLGRQGDQRQERIVQLIGIADYRPRLFGDLRDGLLVQRTDAVRDVCP